MPLRSIFLLPILVVLANSALAQGPPGLFQPPGSPCFGEASDGIGAYLSTVEIGVGTGLAAVAADDFKIADTFELGAVRVWGTYALGKAVTDHFTVRVHQRLEPEDIPGGFLIGSPSVTSTRRLVGTFNSGGFVFDQYEYLLVLNPPVVLDEDPYYIEIYNQAAGWAWQCGTLDLPDGIQGIAGAAEAPGETWLRESEDHDMALQLIEVLFIDGFETGDTIGWSSTVP